MPLRKRETGGGSKGAASFSSSWVNLPQECSTAGLVSYTSAARSRSDSEESSFTVLALNKPAFSSRGLFPSPAQRIRIQAWTRRRRRPLRVQAWGGFPRSEWRPLLQRRADVRASDAQMYDLAKRVEKSPQENGPCLSCPSEVRIPLPCVRCKCDSLSLSLSLLSLFPCSLSLLSFSLFLFSLSLSLSRCKLNLTNYSCKAVRVSFSTLISVKEDIYLLYALNINRGSQTTPRGLESLNYGSVH